MHNIVKRQFSMPSFALAAFILVVGLGGFTSARADSCTIQGNASDVTALLTVTTSFSAQTNLTTVNVSISDISHGVVTSIGFDVPGGVFTANTASLVTDPAHTGFTLSNAPGGVNQFNSAVLDFALLTGANFNGGNPPSGVASGSTGTFTFTVNGNVSTATLLEGAFVRFQSLPSNFNEGSDVGICEDEVEPIIVPEPATMLLFGSGLAGIGAMLRRTKKPR